MDIQSLLFSRGEGWTESKAKAWAKSEGFKYGDVAVTDQYIHIRQFSPKGLKVKRTITLGRGIRAVVAREEDMAAKRRRRSTKEEARRSPRRRARRAREAAPVATEAKKRRRRTRRVKETVATEARRRPRRRRTREAPVVAEAKRPRRRRKRHAAPAQMMEAKRRRRPRRRHTSEAWRGDRAGHAAAARKGWKRRKKSGARESTVSEARRRPRRTAKRRRTREFTYEASRRPRRTRSRRRTGAHAYEARRHGRRRTRTHAYETRRSRSGGTGEKIGMMALAILSAGAGYTIADWIDRYLATYNPAGPADKKPTDKFTSDGAGTLANALNVASSPHIGRIAASLGSIAVPALASVYIKNPFLRHSLEGAAIGAGVKAFSLFWSNVLMPMLAPKGTDADVAQKLQKSMIARLYPAEVAAKINLETNNKTAPPQTAFGALSDPPAPGTVGAPDVGPFALSGSSPYPDAEQALRRAAGLSGESPYPSAGQALRQEAGVGYVYRPHTYEYHPHAPLIHRWRYAHPHYQGGYGSSAQWSQRWALYPQYQAQYAMPRTHHHHHCMLRAKAMFPSYTDAQLHAWCVARPYHQYPYLYEQPQQAPQAGVSQAQDLTNTGLSPQEMANAAPPPPPPPPPPAGGAAPAAPPPPAPEAAAPPPPPAPMPPPAAAPPNPVGPPSYAPGPGTTPG